MSGPPVRVLHVHSTFALGGKEARAVRLMNAFGDRAEHSIVSGVPGAFSASEAIDPAIRVTFPEDHPPLTGCPSPTRYRTLARMMRRFDLVLTYNWGAMDVVMAKRLFGGPPLVHHEDGFNADEAQGQKSARILFRRFALPAATGVVVPSLALERIARNVWKQPAHRVHRVGNGIPVDRYAAPATRDAIPGFLPVTGTVVVGTVAGLRPVKNLPRLVRAVADADMSLRLVIVGEGPDRDAIATEARIRGIADRVSLPGFLHHPERYVGLFDIFSLSSDSEQFPISLIEAMAAGLPVVATDVGDVAEMVAAENRPFIVAPVDEHGFAAALRCLARDPVLRARLGSANRAKAVADYAEDAMIRAYRELYGAAISRAGALG